ncbi:hypothetical protein, partial [Bacillus inaquosorum]
HAKVITTHLFDWFKMQSHLSDEEKKENTSGHKV